MRSRNGSTGAQASRGKVDHHLCPSSVGDATPARTAQGRFRLFASAVPSRVPVEELLSGRPSIIRLGGTGAATRIVCGFFGCDARADRLFLSGLPRIFKVGLHDSIAGEWLERIMSHLLREAQTRTPGSGALLAKASEALFVEAMRRYAEGVREGETGWLAAARDPIVGAALANIHRDPHRPWSLGELAKEAGASRSVHDAARRLEATDDTVPPARYRKLRRSRA